MKQLLLALAIGLTAMGCNRYGQEEELTSDFTGTWRLTEYYDVILNWRKVPKESQYTYTFKKDSTFTSTKFDDCGHGTYRMYKDTLELTYACPDFENYWVKGKTLKEKMVLENKTLILTPTYIPCIEGCDEKFRKMSNH